MISLDQPEFSRGDSAWCWSPYAYLPKPFRVEILSCVGGKPYRYTIRHPQHPNSEMLVEVSEPLLTALSAIDRLGDLARC